MNLILAGYGAQEEAEDQYTQTPGENVDYD